MYVRLAFAVAAHLEPEILFVDEVLAVGDAGFQRKCLGKMEEIGASGRTLVFVSHSVTAVLRLCPRLLLFDAGRLVADGPTAEVMRGYLTAAGGPTAERVWSDGPGPGDQVASLQAVRVRDAGGAVCETVDRREAIVVDVDYACRHETTCPSVRLRFFNEEGTCLFSGCSTAQPPAHGEGCRARVRCRVPGELLAEGLVRVHVALESDDGSVIHALAPEAVAFQVIDQDPSPTHLGEAAHGTAGVMRPRLEWDTQTQPATRT